MLLLAYCEVQFLAFYAVLNLANLVVSFLAYFVELYLAYSVNFNFKGRLGASYIADVPFIRSEEVSYSWSVNL